MAQSGRLSEHGGSGGQKRKPHRSELPKGKLTSELLDGVDTCAKFKSFKKDRHNSQRKMGTV